MRTRNIIVLILLSISILLVKSFVSASSDALQNPPIVLNNTRDLIESRTYNEIISSDIVEEEPHTMENTLVYYFTGIDGQGSIKTQSQKEVDTITIDYYGFEEGKLSNGHVVSITVNIDDTTLTQDVLVKDLVTVWDHFTFEFTGTNGNGRIELTDNNDYVYYKTSFRNNIQSGVSNGQLKNGQYVLVKAYDQETDELLNTITVPVNSLK